MALGRWKIQTCQPWTGHIGVWTPAVSCQREGCWGCSWLRVLQEEQSFPCDCAFCWVRERWSSELSHKGLIRLTPCPTIQEGVASCFEKKHNVGRGKEPGETTREKEEAIREMCKDLESCKGTGEFHGHSWSGRMTQLLWSYWHYTLPVEEKLPHTLLSLSSFTAFTCHIKLFW